jgi:NAD(P)-dependent dehydrogenase (short-subunit alcohol dehydrogenase family)
MLLQGKTAVVYGGGGSIGGAMARAFAREGAHVCLAGRTRGRLDVVAADIRAAGGSVDTAVVDALDGPALRAHAEAVVAATGRLDISVNVIQHQDVQGTPLVEMDVEDFLRPIEIALRTNLLTAQAAAPHMVRQGSGVFVYFGGKGDPVRDYSIGGLQVASTALDQFRDQLASELGRHGIRAVTLRTGGIPESIGGDFEGRDALVDSLVAPTMLGRAATLADVGNVAAFVASDHAASITASDVNVSCGALVS